MATPGLQIGVEGADKLIAAFRELQSSAQKKHLRKALGQSTKDVLWAARAQVPKRSGLLYKSMGRKVKVSKVTGTLTGFVGARTGFRKAVGVRKRAGYRTSKKGIRVAKAAGAALYADPTRYLHLIELGSKHNRAVHMLQGALTSNRGAVEGYLVSAMNAAVADAAKKGGG